MTVGMMKVCCRRGAAGADEHVKINGSPLWVDKQLRESVRCDVDPGDPVTFVLAFVYFGTPMPWLTRYGLIYLWSNERLRVEARRLW